MQQFIVAVTTMPTQKVCNGLYYPATPVNKMKTFKNI